MMSSLPQNSSVSCLIATSYDGEAIRKAATACREKLGHSPDLALVFVSPDYLSQLSALIEHLQIDGHAAMILGASAEGLFGVGHELENTSGFAFSFFHLPETRLQLFHKEQDWADFRRGEIDPAGFLVLANPLRCGGQGPLVGINTAFPGVPALGGMITGGPSEEDLFLYTAAGKMDVDFLALGFFGGLKIVPLVAQGCRPIGEPLVITRSHGNVVQAIAGREPFRVLEETFDALGESLWAEADGNIFAGLAIREEVYDFTEGDFLIRQIVGTDLSTGKLILTSAPRVGQTIQFQLRHAAVAARVLRERCESIRAEHGIPFSTFVCAGRNRGRKLYGEAHRDVSLFGECFGSVPVSGFFGNGEFGSVSGVNFRHDHSLCGALFYSA